MYTRRNDSNSCICNPSCTASPLHKEHSGGGLGASAAGAAAQQSEDEGALDAREPSLALHRSNTTHQTSESNAVEVT